MLCLLSIWVFLYLSINYLKAKDFSTLIDKRKARMDGWSSKSLSFAGRIQQSNSIIHSFLIYWLQSYKFPFSVIKSLEKIICGDPPPPFESAEVVWSQPIYPKMSCCLLGALTNRLFTRSRLLQFGIINQDICVLYSSHMETINSMLPL